MPRKDPQAQREYEKEYRAKNKDRIKANAARHAALHPESIRATAKTRDARSTTKTAKRTHMLAKYRENPEKFRAAAAARRNANPEKHNDSMRRYREANYENVRDRENLRNVTARHPDADPDFTAATVALIKLKRNIKRITNGN